MMPVILAGNTVLSNFHTAGFSRPETTDVMGVYLYPPRNAQRPIDSIPADATFPKTTGLDMLFEERIKAVMLNARR